jgi:DNA mismatch endonuclease (patch repair protein)
MRPRRPAYRSPSPARSRLMASIRSSGNKSTELLFARLCRTHRISGWRRKAALVGSPDFTFWKERLVVFVDGCFWHGCSHCYRAPVRNVSYWQWKIAVNRRRDRRVSRLLRQEGWRVLRVRECSLRKPTRVISRLRSALAMARTESIATARCLPKDWVNKLLSNRQESTGEA